MAIRAFNAKILPFFLPVLLVLIVDATAIREFDYFALALQWPGSYCQKTRHCCSSNGCCRSSPLTEFTIHGLWPDYNDGSYPSCCRNSNFSIEKISSLMPELQKHWPSLSCGSTSLCHGRKGLFWAHEWEKHGTCSNPVILDEYIYFSTALDLYFKYNITKILNNEGILASNAKKYSVEDIISAIKKAVGALPLLECRGSFLEELQLCFDKNFKPRDCYLRSGSGDIKALIYSRKSCPINITLPTYIPLGNGLNGDSSSAVGWLIRNQPFFPLNVI